MDGFFRETKEKVAYRKSEGCSVAEMECSALAACAAFRSATWGMLLYTADSLADVQRYDQRHWGGSAYEYALTLCRKKHSAHHFQYRGDHEAGGSCRELSAESR